MGLFKVGDVVNLPSPYDGEGFVREYWPEHGAVGVYSPDLRRVLTLPEDDVFLKDSPPEVSEFAGSVYATLNDLAEMLIEKNKAYGDSALNPVRIFSKADPVEQIMVRIDDKLSRLARGSEYAGDDTVTDLLGYLVLLKIARDGQSDALPNA